MNRTVTVIFDGEVLRPDAPLNLPPNTRYIVTIQTTQASVPSDDAWDVLDRLAGTAERPDDWSQEHDHYLYGAPKNRAIS
jgi:hypothetical protein